MISPAARLASLIVLRPRPTSSSTPAFVILLLLFPFASHQMQVISASGNGSGGGGVRRINGPNSGSGSDAARDGRDGVRSVRVLSPRSVEIKYGSLRGLLISLEANDSPPSQLPASLMLNSRPKRTASASSATAATSSSVRRQAAARLSTGRAAGTNSSSNPSSLPSASRRRRNDVTANESPDAAAGSPSANPIIAGSMSGGADTRSMDSSSGSREASGSQSPSGSIGTGLATADAGSVTASMDGLMIAERLTLRVNKQRTERTAVAAAFTDASVNRQRDEKKLNETSKRWPLSSHSESSHSPVAGIAGRRVHDHDEDHNDSDDIRDFAAADIDEEGSLRRSRVHHVEVALNGNQEHSYEDPGSLGSGENGAQNDAPLSASLTASSSASSTPSSTIKGRIMGSKSRPSAGSGSTEGSTGTTGGQRGVGGYVEVFRGIPYAALATLRFMPPMTPAYWKGTRLATTFQPVCPQVLPPLPISSPAHSPLHLPLPQALSSSSSATATSSSDAETRSQPPISRTHLPQSSASRTEFASSVLPLHQQSSASTTASMTNGVEEDVGADNLIYFPKSKAAGGSNLNFMPANAGITSPAVMDEDWRSLDLGMESRLTVSIPNLEATFPPSSESEEVSGVRSDSAIPSSGRLSPAAAGRRPETRHSSPSTSASSVAHDSETKDSNHWPHQHLKDLDDDGATLVADAEHKEKDDVTNGDSMPDNESERRQRSAACCLSSASHLPSTNTGRNKRTAAEGDDSRSRSQHSSSSSPSSRDQGSQSSQDAEYVASVLPYLQNQSEDCLYLNVYAPYPESAFRATGEPSNVFSLFYLVPANFDPHSQGICRRSDF